MDEIMQILLNLPISLVDLFIIVCAVIGLFFGLFGKAPRKLWRLILVIGSIVTAYFTYNKIIDAVLAVDVNALAEYIDGFTVPAGVTSVEGLVASYLNVNGIDLSSLLPLAKSVVGLVVFWVEALVLMLVTRVLFGWIAFAICGKKRKKHTAVKTLGLIGAAKGAIVGVMIIIPLLVLSPLVGQADVLLDTADKIMAAFPADSGASTTSAKDDDAYVMVVDATNPTTASRETIYDKLGIDKTTIQVVAKSFKADGESGSSFICSSTSTLMDKGNLAFVTYKASDDANATTCNFVTDLTGLADAVKSVAEVLPEVTDDNGVFDMAKLTAVLSVETPTDTTTPVPEATQKLLNAKSKLTTAVQKTVSVGIVSEVLPSIAESALESDAVKEMLNESLGDLAPVVTNSIKAVVNTEPEKMAESIVSIGGSAVQTVVLMNEINPDGGDLSLEAIIALIESDDFDVDTQLKPVLKGMLQNPLIVSTLTAAKDSFDCGDPLINAVVHNVSLANMVDDLWPVIAAACDLLPIFAPNGEFVQDVTTVLPTAYTGICTLINAALSCNLVKDTALVVVNNYLTSTKVEDAEVKAYLSMAGFGTNETTNKAIYDAAKTDIMSVVAAVGPLLPVVLALSSGDEVNYATLLTNDNVTKALNVVDVLLSTNVVTTIACKMANKAVVAYAAETDPAKKAADVTGMLAALAGFGNAETDETVYGAIVDDVITILAAGCGVLPYAFDTTGKFDVINILTANDNAGVTAALTAVNTVLDTATVKRIAKGFINGTVTAYAAKDADAKAADMIGTLLCVATSAATLDDDGITSLLTDVKGVISNAAGLLPYVFDADGKFNIAVLGGYLEMVDSTTPKHPTEFNAICTVIGNLIANTTVAKFLNAQVLGSLLPDMPAEAFTGFNGSETEVSTVLQFIGNMLSSMNQEPAE